MAFMDCFPNNFNMNRPNTNPCTLVSLGFVVCVFCLVANELHVLNLTFSSYCHGIIETSQFLVVYTNVSFIQTPIISLL
jgi:hypothetical protein